MEQELSVYQSSLSRDTLRGVWPALLTPWTSDDRLDEGRLIREIQHIAQAGVHGTYTGGTAGEFYAQDEALFGQLTRLVCREAHRAGLPIQVGCTALSTRTARIRVEIALEYGADAIQLALPFWLALTDQEVIDYFGQVAEAAGSTPLVFYQTPRAKRRIDPPLLGKLCRAVPTLIGMKDTGCDYHTLQQITDDAPDLAVFGTDVDLLERMRRGTRGSYSSVAGLNAQVVLAIYNHCATGRFELAEPLQHLVRRLMHEVLHPMGRDEGLMDSALDRLQRIVGGGSVGLRCQGPYRSATHQHVERVRDWCRREAPLLLSTGNRPEHGTPWN